MRSLSARFTVYRSILVEGEAKKQPEIALNFLRESLSAAAVVRGTGLPIEEVQQLQQQMDESPQN
ncbi:MAG: hypothetical protein RMY28_021435 [Nostoc sp. ChiSLP01]|nr:hypothetical protein [Nostoc sp. CmiSLP01]MDZ8288060.1 hypothetical protein [Nostoc sp. ChiSLP01]